MNKEICDKYIKERKKCMREICDIVIQKESIRQNLKTSKKYVEELDKDLLLGEYDDDSEKFCQKMLPHLKEENTMIDIRNKVNKRLKDLRTTIKGYNNYLLNSGVK